MFTGNLPIDAVLRVFSRRHGVRRAPAYLLLVALVVMTAACRSQPTPTAQWLPPYLQLRLQAGKAQVQWTGASDWMTLEGKASILIEETVRIVADAIEGAQFSLGDGSGLELGPETVLEVQNPRTLPRLQVILEEGSLLFDARDPSYDLITPVGSLTLLSIPSRVSIEVSDDTTRVAVEEGAVSCVLENETITLLASQEMVASSGEELEVTEFYDASATATASALALSASPTSSEAEATLTPTPTMTPTPSPTPTATRRVVWTPTSTPLPPTDTPKPSSSHKPPPPTQPPPTQPPPTQPPPTVPPPTQPPPTQPRPTVPPPTESPPTEPPPDGAATTDGAATDAATADGVTADGAARAAHGGVAAGVTDGGATTGIADGGVTDRAAADGITTADTTPSPPFRRGRAGVGGTADQATIYCALLGMKDWF